jgi:hypothetical protein
MLIDLLNSSNYIMVNMDAIRIFGLNTAVYCAELLNIYKKAVTKKKLYDDVYFKIDRDYIRKQTSIEVEDQLKCDANLLKVNVIKINEENPDIIFFDVEVYASILSSEDVKLLDKVSAKVKVANPKGTKQAQRDRVIIALKESIECKTFEVLSAMKGWIDSVMADPKRYLSKQQVAAFKERLDDYCNGDLQKALEIIRLATVHAYVDCQWAINVYERNNQPARSQLQINTVRVTEQKKTVEVGEDAF